MATGFKSGLFGFDKRDVLNYIEETHMKYAEKEAEMILDHWRCLECEFNSDFYDEDDEFEIDELEEKIAKSIQRKNMIIRIIIQIAIITAITFAFTAFIRSR